MLAVFTSVRAQKRPTATEIAAAGTFTGQEYSNPSLGLSMLAPGGWSFYTGEQNQISVEQNKQIAQRSSDQNLVKAAENTQVLFQANPPKYLGQEKSALFSCGVETLAAPSTSLRYLEYNKGLILAGGTRLTKDVFTTTYGNASFAEFDIEGVRKDGTYRQRYIATVRKNVAVFFVITLFDNRQDEIVAASLKSIKFR
ncbi:MAG: hypothetical protein JO053_12965 [Acidobacteria bacterium]|nr:hypothetical protein [Acidobacteriota bacterium]